MKGVDGEVRLEALEARVTALELAFTEMLRRDLAMARAVVKDVEGMAALDRFPPDGTGHEEGDTRSALLQSTQALADLTKDLKGLKRRRWSDRRVPGA